VLATPGLGTTLLRRTPIIERMVTHGTVHPEAWANGEARTFAEVLRQPAYAQASARLYRTFLLHEVRPYLAGENDGRRLTVPTRMLFGTRDPVIRPEGLGRWREHADDMTVELRDDAGHFIGEELPEFVAERALALFDGAG
jgi:pimeloyl-ACP methyl ester carboxylesterase